MSGARPRPVSPEDDLKQLISLLRATLESTADGLLVVDLDGRISTYNRQFAVMWRIPEDVLASRDDDRAIAFVLDQLVSPEQFLRKLRELYATPDAESFDVLEFKDGRSFERYSRPQSIEGRPVGRVWSFRDVTVTRRVGDALQRERAFLRQVIDINPHLIFAKDRDGRFTLVNEAVAAVYGTTPEGLIGKTDADFNPNPAEVEFFRRADLAVIDSRQEMIIPEERVTDSTGSVRWLQTVKRPVIAEDGRVHQVLGVATDITEWRRSQEVLRHSEERFAKAFRASPAAVSISRLTDGRYVDVNDAFVRLLGYGRQDVIGRTSLQIGLWVDPADRPRLAASLENQESLRGFATRFRTKTGEVREVVIAAERIDVDGEACILALSSDVTEQKRLEEQLLQSQKMEAIGRMAGGIAHDFNNLLTTILGYSELILRAHPADGTLHDEVAEIKKASERAASLTHQLLAFSRKQVIAPRVLSLNETVGDAMKLLRRLIGEDIDLVSDLDPDLGTVRADPIQIEQVLLNLAINSRDAMPRGGQITLSTRNVALSEPIAGLHFTLPSGEYAVLSVSDDGVGMDAATQSRIFEPFFTTKEMGKGTGLGLSTVYGIVKQSGGFIFVKSAPDDGTLFEIYLPRLDPSIQLPRPCAPPPSETFPGGSETILIAEDEEPLRRLARRILEGQGYTVLDAGSAEEAYALAELSSGSVRLLIADIVMTKGSGRDLARRVLARWPDTKVLFVSGYANGSVGGEGALEPGTNFLQKPFTPDVLIQRVREVLDGKPALRFQ